MLEILLTLVCLLLARKGGRRRNFARYIRGNVNEEQAIGTLAAKTMISSAFDDTVSEKARISSVVATWTISNWTGANNNGPLLVGVAHSSYSTAQIEAWLEATSGWQSNDLVAQEVAQRRIRTIGSLAHPRQSTIQQVSLNDGKPVKTKLNWVLETGATVQMWCFNQGTAAFATTDPMVRVEGHANLWKM